MTFLATPPREQRQQLQVLGDTPSDPTGLEPGFFEGAGTAAAVGLGRVAAVANQLAGEAEAPFVRALSRPLDALFDTDATRWVDDKFVAGPRALTAQMTPDPYTTGFLGQVLYGLVGIGVPAIAGAYAGGPLGAAALAGSFDAAGTTTDLQAQGVDPATAAQAGAVSGVFTAAGVGAPAAIGGRAALSTLLYGPGINVAQDVAARQSIAGLLDARGYDALGDHYAEIEAQYLAADVVLGAAFGWAGARGVPRGTVRPARTGDVDAAHVALDRRHVEIDTAPGIAVDPASLKLHVGNLGKATEALLAGKPVTVRSTEGTFVHKPVNPAFADDVLVSALKESGYLDDLAEIGQLEAALAARGRADPGEPLPAVRDVPSPIAEAAPAAFEGATPAAPGMPVRVLRVAGQGEPTLAGKNAANVDGMVNFLAAVDDFESPNGAHVGDDAMLQVWEYRTPAAAGSYQPLVAGRAAPPADHYGRGRQFGGEGSAWYSFGADVAAGARLVREIPLAEVRAAKGRYFEGTAAETAWLQQYVEGRLADAGRPAVPRATTKTGERQYAGEFAAIEDRFADWIAADVDGAIRTYEALPDAEGGKVINTDVARELSPDYRADRTRSAAVHEPASWLVKEMYRRKLAEPLKPGEKPVVLFTGGGTGAGKSTAIDAIPAMKKAKKQAKVVYDTNMNTLGSAVDKIEQALKAGLKVHVAFVLRDPVEGLVKGALPRADRMGRTVPLAEHARTYRGVAEVAPALAERYKNDPRVKISVIDNTHGKGNAKKGDVALAATFDYDGLTERLRAALDGEYEKGNVTEAVYRGTAGETATSRGLRRATGDAGAGGGGAAGRAVRSGLRGLGRDSESGNARNPERANRVDPGVERAATAAIVDAPDLTITDPAGEPVPAAAALADADFAVARAQQDAPGFEAAVDCYLRRGA